MDRPPSFPPYQTPNPNFFHHCTPPQNPNLFYRPPPPLQNPNTNSIPPSPPPIPNLSDTLSSLQSLLSEYQTTLASLDHSSLLQNNNNSFVRCPFDSNHHMPPESLFLHSLHCPNSINLTHLLESFNNYRNPLKLQSNDFGTNFFYNDCPGAVNLSKLNNKNQTLKLPDILCIECNDCIDDEEEEEEEKNSLGILPSGFIVIKNEVDRWRDLPNSYSYNVRSAILGSGKIDTIELSKWILVSSTRYGVIIDTYMRDQILLLFRLCLKSIVKEAYGFVKDCDRRAFDCVVLVQVLSWLATQLSVLYGEGNGKLFALDMFKQFVVQSASSIMLYKSERTKPESSGVVEVTSMSSVVAAVAALHERSMFEEKIRAIRYPQHLTRFQRVAELTAMTVKAEEERKGRSSYRPIIDHDGFPRQRLSNHDMNKTKTREELLAEERDYKRRRMTYRGKKVKRTPKEVLRDMIQGFTEEVKLAGGIGCFEKGMPIDSSSSIGKDQKESDFGYDTVSRTVTDASPRSYKQRKGEKHTDKKRYEEEYHYDSSSSHRQKSHRSSTYSDKSNYESSRTKRHSLDSESYHQTHRSSRDKSSSDSKRKRDDVDDDRYNRYSKESRSRNSFEDRYNPVERD